MDRRVVRRVVEKLAWLAERADEFVHQPLHGEWAGCFKLRFGGLASCLLSGKLPRAPSSCTWSVTVMPFTSGEGDDGDGVAVS